MSFRHSNHVLQRLARPSAVVTALVLVGVALGPVDAGAAADATIRVHQQDVPGAAVLGGCWRANGPSATVERCDIDDGAVDGVTVLDGLDAATTNCTSRSAHPDTALPRIAPSTSVPDRCST